VAASRFEFVNVLEPPAKPQITEEHTEDQVTFLFNTRLKESYQG
jgi:hypothetical protein